MREDDDELDVGDESVVMGDVAGRVGNRSVVIGPTDADGKTVLDRPMAVGYGTVADPTSIAIGAGAVAGDQTTVLLAKLAEVIQRTGDPKLVQNFGELIRELRRPKRDQRRVAQLWHAINAAAAPEGAASLLIQVGTAIGLS